MAKSLEFDEIIKDLKLLLAEKDPEVLFSKLDKLLLENGDAQIRLKEVRSNYRLNKKHQITGIAGAESVDLVNNQTLNALLQLINSLEPKDLFDDDH